MLAEFLSSSPCQPYGAEPSPCEYEWIVSIAEGKKPNVNLLPIKSIKSDFKEETNMFHLACNLQGTHSRWKNCK